MTPGCCVMSIGLRIYRNAEAPRPACSAIGDSRTLGQDARSGGRLTSGL